MTKYILSIRNKLNRLEFMKEIESETPADAETAVLEQNKPGSSAWEILWVKSEAEHQEYIAGQKLAAAKNATEEEKTPARRATFSQENVFDFLKGFLGWFAGITILWSFVGFAYKFFEEVNSTGNTLLVLLCCPPILLILSVFIFFRLFKTQRVIAFGMLSAVGLNSISAGILMLSQGFPLDETISNMLLGLPTTIPFFLYPLFFFPPY
jgi:hypothetical protein